jgi:hypothetical protein
MTDCCLGTEAAVSGSARGVAGFPQKQVMPRAPDSQRCTSVAGGACHGKDKQRSEMPFYVRYAGDVAVVRREHRLAAEVVELPEGSLYVVCCM